MDSSIMWYYLLPLVGFLITLIAQIFISVNYKKYKKEQTRKGMSGFEVARMILDKNGLKDVHVVEIKGELTDHYDPRRKVVRLSSEIFHGTTIASNSVAAHECGHAIQDKNGYVFMRIRSMLVPLVNISTKIGYLVIGVGLLFSVMNWMFIGIILLLAMLMFQLVTLPVEFDASKRGKEELNKLNILASDELEGSNTMLKAAAFTYVASLVATFLEIFRYILIFASSNRD